MIKKSGYYTIGFTVLALFGVVTARAQSNQLLNLPPLSSGFRYTQAQLEFQWPANHGEGSVCLWGDDKFAAVSFTIDDNIPKNWSFWRQMSARYGWKFTWFVIVYPYMWDVYNNVPGNNQSGFGTAADFKLLHDEGHDIQVHGNVDMNLLEDPDYGDLMVRERNYLEPITGGPMCCFAYPGGNPSGMPVVVDRPAVARPLVVAARGMIGYGVANPATLDYIKIPTIGPALDTSSSSSYWVKLEQKNNNLQYSDYRGWAVILNHLIQDSDTNNTIAQLEFIKANEYKYWVKPFSYVARYGQERDSSTLLVTQVAADQIQFTLTDLMRDDYFDIPLTVKFRVDNWGGAVASQNGHSIPVRMTNYNGDAYALVDAVPDQGEVTLSKADSAGFTASPVSGWNPLTVLFADISTFAGITNRYWDFGDGTTTNTTETNVVYTYTVDGTYTVQLVVSGSDGVYTNIQNNLISLTTPIAPSAGFSVSPASGSLPLVVTFTDTSIGTITNRYWDFGDGNTTNTASTSLIHIYTSEGTDTVALTVSGPAGINTDTQTAAVTVTPPVAPSAGFTVSTNAGIAPLAVTFTDTSTGSITNRYWDFGDGSTTNTTLTGLTHTYTSAGTNTVTLTVSGSSGASTNVQTDLIQVSAPVPTEGLAVYDPFDSAITAPQTAGWAPPGWITDGTIANGSHGYIKGGSLTVSGLEDSVGNSFGLGSRADDYMLNFPPVTLAVGDTIYFSFIEKYNVMPISTYTGVGGYLRLGNSATALTTADAICIARGSDGAPTASNAGFSISPSNKTYGGAPGVSTSGIYDMLATYLIVGSYTRGATATGGSLKLWINPDSASFGTANPPAPTLTMASSLSVSTFNQLRIGANSSNTHSADWQIDEVRIGTDWASVVPSSTPESGGGTPAADSDSDGIPDSWETQYFGGATNANPDTLAANGRDTIREAYITGLDPTDSAACFAVSNDWKTLHWNAVSGRVYSVYWTTNLTEGFQPLETNILWPQSSWTGQVSGAQGGDFYKLGVQMMP